MCSSDLGVILWNHMRPDQPAMQHFFNPEIQKKINHIVYVSESQQKAFIDHAPEANKGHVIGNAISPAFENLFSSVEDIVAIKECRGVYTSTPFRGLAVLSSIKEMEIDIFSSMKVYQSDDSVFDKMYENLKANDCLKLNGSVSQTVLAEKLRSIAFLVYPSIFAECHSIALLEAMAAGLKVITTDKASPPTEFIDSMPSGGSVDDYAKMLRKNIYFFRSRPEEWAAERWKQVQRINAEFTWKKRAEEWEKHLLFLAGNLNRDA